MLKNLQHFRKFSILATVAATTAVCVKISNVHSRSNSNKRDGDTRMDFPNLDSRIRELTKFTSIEDSME